ncbi:MAG: energy-coupling factor ABC transporter permease [Muribaculaceae bacterium]|nr:energy-coupling factor ABC transporter permease [Muribaculaceae bacterium]
MHLADALISPSVAATTGAISLALIALSSKKVKESSRPEIIPLMGVMGAFVFAAQMINFTIPATGSSGHLIGGILLAAILGPWAAFITLCSILIVQCLFFADGGLMALGCNIINMAAFTCLLGYPLIYKPIAGGSLKPVKITLASVVASIVALELGAFAVTLETELSGITSLPFLTFLSFMMPIHLAIGLVEGMVTAALLIFLAQYRPSALYEPSKNQATVKKGKLRPIFIGFAVLTLFTAGGLALFASKNPDGLEWSIAKVAGDVEFGSEVPSTAIMPDYNSDFAGIVGALIVMVLLWAISSLIFSRFKKS